MTEEEKFARYKELRAEYGRTVPLAHPGHYSKVIPYQNWLEDVVLQRETEIKALQQERDESVRRTVELEDAITETGLILSWCPEETRPEVQKAMRVLGSVMNHPQVLKRQGI